LGYYFDKESKEPESTASEQIIEVTPIGPLMAYGKIEIRYKDGTTEKRYKVTAFCRCGGSENKPFCDGTQKKIGFEG